MALGEAFVNVHADLKPFAKELDKGIKAILKQAEQTIRRDPGIGRAMGDSIRQHTAQGARDGLDEGLDEGMKRGTRKALSTGANFFATLADFADDGLSAIPAEVKAAIVIGVAGAATVVGPLLAGAVSAAVTTGVALGVIGAGIALASQFRVVEDQFTALGRDLLDRLRSASQAFIEPLVAAGAQIRAEFTDVEDLIRVIFAQAALNVKPLTDALTGFVRELLPGIAVAVTKIRPLIQVLATSLPELGRAFATAFAILADGSSQSYLALRDLITIIGTLVIVTAGFIRLLSDLYFWLRVVSKAMTGDIAEAAGLMAERENAAALATGEITGALDTMNPALSRTAAEANAARLAISGLIGEQLQGVNAIIDYQQAIDDLQKSIREGHRDFRVTTDQGRDNLRRVESAIVAAGRERDAAIANAAATGQSVDQINAAYLREIAVIEQVIGKNIQQDKTLKDLFATARSAPKEVSIEVTTPGLNKAITDWKRFGAAIQSAISKLLSAGAAAITGGGGLKTTVQKYADGGIARQPTMGIVAEAGYAEAVIPDPRVKPQRALQLANEFGLTALIADTMRGAASVINVFVGNEKLAQFVDYRVSAGNALNATAMAQGPRGTL